MHSSTLPRATGARAAPAGPLTRLITRRLRTTPPAAVLFLLNAACLAFGEPDRVSLVIGGVISLLGELVRIVTAGYGYKVGELQVRGPYRFVRHPYFLGTALLHLGICIASRNPYVMAAGMALVTLLHRRRFRTDEERLRRRLGPAFVDYVARVPAFLPQLLPTSSHLVAGDKEKHSFSIRIAVLTGRHRELDALLGLLLVYVLFELELRGFLEGLFRPAIMVTTVAYAIFRLVYFGFIRHRP